ncbi:hypothetical protein [Mesorhizobium sp. M0621]
MPISQALPAAIYGAAFGATCTMHQRIMSLDNQMLNKDAVSDSAL